MRRHLTIDALSILLPATTEAHPNKAPFRGVLTRIDEASTRPPNGAEGHRVFIPRAVAEAALPSLQGMPIDCTLILKEHDKTNIVGIIDEGRIEGNDLVVNGYLLEKNQPDAVAEIRRLKDQLGMSYEVSDVGVDDMAAPIWTLNHVMFTGAAILLKDKAAYAKTAIAAQADEETLMAVGDTILDELRTLRRDVGDLAAARKDDDDEDAARKDEDAAHVAEADAAKARDDDDEEEAAKHDASAATLRVNAMKRRDEAAKRHRDEAAKRKEAADEEGAAAHLEAATYHEAEAKRLRDEDAARQVAAQARIDAMTHRGVPKAMQDMLEAIGYVPKQSVQAARGDDDEDMQKLFGMFLLAMVYPAGPIRGKRRAAAAAAHDDEAEDRALFRRLIERHREGALEAGGRDELDTRRMARRLERIEAGMGLITDTLKQQTGLITDLVQKARTLATDTHRPGQGGPVRTTMQATGTERWVSQLEGGGTADPNPDKKFTIAQIDAAMADQNLNIREQMAKKLALSWAGQIIEE